jgi:hypothetical protein
MDLREILWDFHVVCLNAPNNAAVTGIEFFGLENPHTATPDDPYWSPQGKAYASIKEAAAQGEITPEDAIAAYRRLADAAAK